MALRLTSAGGGPEMAVVLRVAPEMMVILRGGSGIMVVRKDGGCYRRKFIMRWASNITRDGQCHFRRHVTVPGDRGGSKRCASYIEFGGGLNLNLAGSEKCQAVEKSPSTFLHRARS